MTSSNLSETIRQSIVNANYNFETVINDVAVGFKQCGFFDKADWNNMLEQCFSRKRLGITRQEMKIYTSVMSSPPSDDISYDNCFTNGFNAVSTPYLATQKDRENRFQIRTRNKRSSTTTAETTPQDNLKKMKKTNSMNETTVASILVDMKNHTDWGQIVPSVNAKQQTVKYETVFDKSKQLQSTDTATENVIRSEPMHKVATVAAASQNVCTSSTIDKPDEVEVTPRHSIKKRRNAIFRPLASKPTNPVTVSLPAAVVNKTVQNKPKAAGKTAKTKSLDAQPTTVSANDSVQTNIPARRMTRLQTNLMAAFSGTAIHSNTERRSTIVFQRTSVLFTMIDTLPFKEILNKYNIFVADTNEKYDYVIAERICRSPKFLSAVIAGKPIISINWIHALKEKSTWLDPLNYLLQDDDGEKEYDFKLATTLQLATNKRLFDKYSILVTTNISIGTDLLKGVIFSGGGKFLKTTLVPRRGDEVICISSEIDKKVWPKLHTKYPALKKIISLDGFTKMIFQYTTNVTPADILHQF